MTSQIKVKHEGFFIYIGNILMNEEGCKELAQLLLAPIEERKDFVSKLESRIALIQITNGKLWSEG